MSPGSHEALAAPAAEAGEDRAAAVTFLATSERAAKIREAAKGAAQLPKG